MTPARQYRILIIEDDQTLNHMLADHIGRMGHTAIGVFDRAGAMDVMTEFDPDLAILDLRLPDTDGMTFLSELRDYCPVLVITAFGTIDQAVRAVRSGAGDYLVKPVSTATLELALQRFFNALELRRDLDYWRAQARATDPPAIIGDSAAMTELRRLVALYAPAETPVLILGEPGTGKETVARVIHATSPRANGRFVPVDCGPGLEPGDLFGSAQGRGGRDGLLAAADAGTIYLSGIDRLSEEVQLRLLRAIETLSFSARPGGATRAATARFVLSSSLSAEALAQAARRNELLHYLGPFTIEIAPLRERREDIALLAGHHLANRSFQRNVEKSLAPAAIAALERHDWPGNVRELKNTIERALIMSQGASEITTRHLHAPLAQRPVGVESGFTLHFDTTPTLDEMRDAYVARLLSMHGGNRRLVASVLGISERNLYRLIRPT